MTSVSARPARKRDAEATRAAILNAARQEFARNGFDSTSLRQIAAVAGIDVALINRYFGGKVPLFTEALKASFAPDFLSHWDKATFPEDFASVMAGHANEDEERTQNFRFLLLAATSPATGPMLSAAIQERFLAPIRHWLGDEQATASARVLAAVAIGFLVERLIRGEPLAGPERAQFIDRAAAVCRSIIQPEGHPAPLR